MSSSVVDILRATPRHGVSMTQITHEHDTASTTMSACVLVHVRARHHQRRARARAKFVHISLRRGALHSSVYSILLSATSSLLSSFSSFPGPDLSIRVPLVVPLSLSPGGGGGGGSGSDDCPACNAPPRIAAIAASGRLSLLVVVVVAAVAVHCLLLLLLLPPPGCPSLSAAAAD